MAKLGDLIVNIGANTKGLNKELGKVRREMKRFGSNFKSLGQDLTRSVSLPLLAIGAAAVKSASDLETLETSFISLTGGAEQASAMMAQLNEFTAKTPFQIDAVANSARQLIASGTEISQVNNQLQFLGDIAATSGSSIDEIAAIFSKVQAKGKVELESLNQLAERGIPIFRALSEATGLPGEKLGAGRVSVEQFNAVLKSFAEEGGFAAGAMERLSETAAGKFSTALDNLKLAGAELVESLMRALKGAIDFITKLAQKFIALDDGTKKTILVVGGLVAAIGPLLVLLPQIAAAAAMATKVFAGLSLPILAIGAGIAAAVLAFNDISRAWESSKSSSQKLRDTMRGVTTSVISQTKEAKTLVAMYGKEKTSLEDRERILNRLKEIDATHFDNLSAENTTIEDLNRNLKDYVANIRNVAIEKALGAEGQEIYNKAAQAEIDLFDAKTALAAKEEELIDQGIERDSIRFKLAMQSNANLIGAVKHYTSVVEQSAEDIEEFENRKAEILKKYSTVSDQVTDNLVENSNESSAAVEDSAEVTEEAVDNIIKKLNELNFMKTPRVFQTLSDGVREFTAESSLQLLAFLDDMELVGEKTSEIANNVDASFESFTQGVEASLTQASTAMLSNLGAMMGGAEMGAEGILTPLANAAISLGELAIGYGIAIEGIKKALKSLSGPVAIVAGIALVALGTTLKNSIAEAAAEDLPELAAGGLAFGPTTALVGDNKNAAIDPEVIAPLSKLKDLMGGEGTQVYGRISGDDIVISNRRAERDRNRFG